MKVIELKVEELIEYEKNPRKNDNAVKYVANSIKEFGFRVPVIVDENNVIVCGHTRVKAAKELGMETVPCVIADDLTEEQIKAYRLADNKVSEMSKWEFDLLSEELAELSDAFNMEDFAFLGEADIDWASITELTEDTYEEPDKNMLRCPVCGAIDNKIRFKKVNKNGEEL